jgi:hypothetical protein
VNPQQWEKVHSGTAIPDDNFGDVDLWPPPEKAQRGPNNIRDLCSCSLLKRRSEVVGEPIYAL